MRHRLICINTKRFRYRQANKTCHKKSRTNKCSYKLPKNLCASHKKTSHHRFSSFYRDVFMIVFSQCKLMVKQLKTLIFLTNHPLHLKQCLYCGICIDFALHYSFYSFFKGDAFLCTYNPVYEFSEFCARKSFQEWARNSVKARLSPTIDIITTNYDEEFSKALLYYVLYCSRNQLLGYHKTAISTNWSLTNIHIILLLANSVINQMRILRQNIRPLLTYCL